MRTMDAFFRDPSGPSSGDGKTTLTRAGLRRAKFVAQVDNKFLLVSVPSTIASERDLLVMIDQHAADERVRVEKFLDDLCGGKKLVEEWVFETKIPVLISVGEAKVVKERQADFERWGIRTEFDDHDFSPTTAIQSGADGTKELETTSYVQLYLLTVPLLVSDRLRVESRLQQELVRSFAAQLAESDASAWTGAKESEDDGTWSWLSSSRSCPPVILDLIYSKACRGAIMFNDRQPFSPAILIG